MEIGKANRLEALEKQIRILEEKIYDVSQVGSRNVDSAKKQIMILLNEIEENKTACDLIYENRQKQVKLLEFKLSEIFEQLLNSRKELEKKLILKIEEKQKQMLYEISKEANITTEEIRLLKNSIGEEFPKLYNTTKQEINNREYLNQEISKKLNGEMDILKDLLNSEKKTREEEENAMIEIVKEMISKLRYNLEKEKEERKINEDSMITLLENTFSKLSTLSIN